LQQVEVELSQCLWSETINAVGRIVSDEWEGSEFARQLGEVDGV